MLRQPNDREMICQPNPSTSLVTGATNMRVLFTDPITSGCIEADVNASSTAAECFQSPVENDALRDGQYQLVVNGQTMSPNQSLADAGAVDGCTIAVHKIETGAISLTWTAANSAL
jgi:hypothetical protein